MNELNERRILILLVFTFLIGNVYVLLYVQDGGNRTLQDANEAVDRLPEGSVILGGWAHAICLETRHTCYTLCKGGDDLSNEVVGKCDFNWRTPIEDLGVTHIVVDVTSGEPVGFEPLLESYPNIEKLSHPLVPLTVGNRKLNVYVIHGTIEELKGEV